MKAILKFFISLGSFYRFLKSIPYLAGMKGAAAKKASKHLTFMYVDELINKKSKYAAKKHTVAELKQRIHNGLLCVVFKDEKTKKHIEAKVMLKALSKYKRLDRDIYNANKEYNNYNIQLRSNPDSLIEKKYPVRKATNGFWIP